MTTGLRKLARSWVFPFVDPRRILSLAFMPRFFRELHEYRSRSAQERVKLVDAYPCLTDRVSHTPFDPHYVYQGAWLARRLKHDAPERHFDVGSSVLSAQVPTCFVDYRPLQTDLPGLRCIAANITSLPFADSSIESLSSLHVIEHIGLGRYGDPLDPDGSAKAAGEFLRVLKPGGRLFVSVPVGGERVCFNAHRVFDPHSIVRMFDGLEISNFSLVDDSGHFTESADINMAAGLDYGCGMFEFLKNDGND